MSSTSLPNTNPKNSTNIFQGASRGLQVRGPAFSHVGVCKIQNPKIGTKNIGDFIPEVLVRFSQLNYAY